jgi:hypothetical protein
VQFYVANLKTAFLGMARCVASFTAMKKRLTREGLLKLQAFLDEQSLNPLY